MHQKYNDLENGHCTQACVFTRSTDFVMPTTDSIHGTPHQLLKHIDFPYYNEKTLPKDQIIAELDYFIEALCKAESYINEKPSIGFQYTDTEQQQHQQQSELDITIIDWDSFNISNYDIQQHEQPTSNIYTTATPSTPIHISISSLWNILRLQQICESKENMIEILKSNDNERDFYQISDNDTTLVVSKSFNWEDDSESVKSFSSREDW